MKIASAMALFLCCLLVAQTQQPALFQFEEETKANPLAEQLELGKQAFEDGLYKPAERYFSKYIELNGVNEPGYARGTLYKAKSCLKDARPADALAAIQEHAQKSAGLKDVMLQSELKLAEAQARGMQGDWKSTRKITTELCDAPTFKDLPKTLQQDFVLLAADAAKYLQDWKGVLSSLKDWDLNSENAFPFVQRMARAYTELGEYAQSLKLLNEFKLKEGSPDAMLASLLRVRNLVKNNEGQQARTIFDILKERMPDKPDYDWWSAVISLAEASSKDGNYKEADALYGNALKLAPDTERQRLTLSRNMDMNLRAELIEEARSNLQKITELFPDSLERLELTGRLGNLLHSKGDFNEAASYFRQLVEYNHNYVQLRYVAGINLGECLYLSGQRQMAVDAYLRADASASTPDEHALALLRAANAALATFREEKNSEAKVAFAEKVIAILSSIEEKYSNSSHSLTALLWKAGLLAEMGRFADAAPVYGNYAKKVQDADEAMRGHLLQGECMRRAASGAEEKLSVAKYLEGFAANASGKYIDDVWFETAKAYREAGDFQHAEEALENILNKTESQRRGDALYMRACVRFDSDKTAEARADVADFQEHFPERKDECDRLSILAGDAFANVGDWSAALKCYALPASQERQSPLRATALYEAAMAEYRLKGYDAALKYLDALLELAGQDEKNAANMARVNYLKGDIHSARMDYAAARDAYALCVMTAGNTMLAYSALGRQGDMLMANASMHKADETLRNADLKAASDCYSRIIKDNLEAGNQYAPIVQAAEYSLAQCQVKQGNIEGALETYEKIYLSYRNNYVDHGGDVHKPRPMDDFYMANALVDMIALLEKKGDPDSLDKVRRYRSFLAGRKNLPISKTARERL